MLYAKIYLDKDEEGRDLLVFDSSQTDDGYKFKVAGEKKTASSLGGINPSLISIIK